MEHDVTAAVDEYRHGIQNRALEVQRLQDVVVGLESEGDRAVRPRALAASLRHARRDLAAAERALDELRHDYARFRLREALGHDPDHLDDRAVDEELLAISVNSFSRKENRYPLAGAIGFETFRELLLAGLPLGQLIENERARHKNDIIFDAPGDETATKTILRQWAARTHPDPYVSDLLRRAAMATSIYDDSLAAFQRALNDLRVNYEIRQRDADSVVFSFEGNTPVIQASNAWENIERVFPEQARRLAEHFLKIGQTQQELEELSEELDAELRAFMAAFVPRYVTYATRQSRTCRRRLGRFNAGRLCEYLLGEIDDTGFLLPGGGGLELAPPRIPRGIRAFSKTKAFRDHRSQAEQRGDNPERAAAAEPGRSAVRPEC